ncbi:MAG: response regulator, partial [Clostridia bacterium]
YSLIIADDEENIRTALINAVDWSEIGFEIVGEASNGIEALELIEKLEPDLLVSDIKMPFMSGIDLVRAARDIRPNMQIVFLTGYDHFEYAKQAIKYNILEYLLKPLSKSDIVTEFTNIRKKLDEKFGEILDVNEQNDLKRENMSLGKTLYFNAMLEGDLDDYVAKENFENLGMKIPYDAKAKGLRYVLCLIKGVSEIKSKNDEVVFKQLYNVVKIVSEKYFPCECFVFGKCIVVLACEKEVALTKYLKFMSKDIVLSSKRVVETSVYVGVSGFFDEINAIAKASEEALDALSYIDKSDEQIIHYSDIATGKEDALLEGMVAKFDEKLKSGDEKQVEEYIDEVFKYINANKLSQSEFNAYIMEILFMNFKTLRTINIEAEETNKLVNQFVFNKPKAELEREIKKLSLEIAANINNQRQKTVDILAESAWDIIQQEYSNPEMSLNILSERLHVSPNYLSSLIKKSKGDSFVNLLTEVRMTKAKDMLLMTNKKIMEVAEAVGYADQHYFSYCFKKHFKTSPNKIREQTFTSGGGNL